MCGDPCVVQKGSSVIFTRSHEILKSKTTVQLNYGYTVSTDIPSFHSSREDMNFATSIPMCGFIAQLVEHRTGIVEVTSSNPVEALIFFQASSFQLVKLENFLR